MRLAALRIRFEDFCCDPAKAPITTKGTKVHEGNLWERRVFAALRDYPAWASISEVAWSGRAMT